MTDVVQDAAMVREAPYPADTRAKGWRMELDMELARQSDTWALASAELRPWLLMLWAVAWEQTPCGSLPADDALIAARIGMSAKAFAKARHILLRKWWLAGDGRLYHDVLVSRVARMMTKRFKESDRKALARSRAAVAGPPDTGPVPSDAEPVPSDTALVPRDNHGTHTVREARPTPEPEPEPIQDLNHTHSREAPPAAAPPPAGGESGVRGTRLPKSWTLPDAWRACCADIRPDLDPDVVAAKFRDHWVAKAGKEAAKADWLAAWRNWVRNERVAPANGAPQAETTYQRTMREKVEQMCPEIAARRPGSGIRNIAIAPINFDQEVIDVAARIMG